MTDLGRSHRTVRNADFEIDISLRPLEPSEIDLFKNREISDFLACKDITEVVIPRANWPKTIAPNILHLNSENQYFIVKGMNVDIFPDSLRNYVVSTIEYYLAGENQFGLPIKNLCVTIEKIVLEEPSKPFRYSVVAIATQKALQISMTNSSPMYKEPCYILGLYVQDSSSEKLRKWLEEFQVKILSVTGDILGVIFKIELPASMLFDFETIIRTIIIGNCYYEIQRAILPL